MSGNYTISHRLLSIAATWLEVPHFFSPCLSIPSPCAISHVYSRVFGALSACGRFRRNGTPAPGLAASASIAPLGVYIYAVGGESCRIRARPEAVRSAGGGEIARAWHVLALGSPVSPSSLPTGGTVRPPAPSAADPRRVASSRNTAPRLARASARLPRTGRPPPPCVRSSSSPSDPDPTSGGVCPFAAFARSRLNAEALSPLASGGRSCECRVESVELKCKVESEGKLLALLRCIA